MGLFAEAGRQIDYQKRLSSLLGWQDAIRFRAAMFGPRVGLGDGRLLTLHPASLLHPVEMRIDSTDADVYGQVLVESEYAAIATGDPRIIVDCGANAGYTSAYLLSRFPLAHVVAIEPFAANAALCRRNLAAYGRRAKVVQAAVWSRSAKLVIEHDGGNEWGVRVRPARIGEAGEVDAIDIPSLGLEAIDILKIDIEGAEADLFAENTESWLPRVRNIAIELHSPECERVFRAAMSHYSFTETRSGELTICTGISLAAG